MIKEHTAYALVYTKNLSYWDGEPTKGEVHSIYMSKRIADARKVEGKMVVKKITFTI